MINEKEDTRIFIGDLEKADVLAALYNASRPQGMGFMHYDPTPMKREEAEELLKRNTYFDYLKGRVMKVDLSGDNFDLRSYDRDNGPGAAKAVIDVLRNSKSTNPDLIKKMHRESTLESAKGTQEELLTPTQITEEGVMVLGLNEVADIIGPKIDLAIKKHQKYKVGNSETEIQKDDKKWVLKMKFGRHTNG